MKGRKQKLAQGAAIRQAAEAHRTSALNIMQNIHPASVQADPIASITPK